MRSTAAPHSSVASSPEIKEANCARTCVNRMLAAAHQRSWAGVFCSVVPKLCLFANIPGSEEPWSRGVAAV